MVLNLLITKYKSIFLLSGKKIDLFIVWCIKNKSMGSIINQFMNQFKENIKLLFDEEHIFVFNIEYLYDEIGKSLNKVVNLFWNWKPNLNEITFADKQLIQNSPCFYLNHNSILLKELLIFCKKFSKLKNIYIYSISKIVDCLMMLILKKVDQQTQAKNHIILPNLYAKTLFTDDPNGKSVSVEVSYFDDDVFSGKVNFTIEIQNLTRDYWASYKEIYDVIDFSDSSDYEYIFVKSPKEYCSMSDDVVLENFLKFLFKEDYEFLNFDHARENLLPFHRKYLESIRNTMKKFKSCDLDTEKSETNDGGIYYWHPFEGPIEHRGRELCGLDITEVVILTWVCAILSKYFQKSIRSPFSENHDLCLSIEFETISKCSLEGDSISFNESSLKVFNDQY
jgi:hypothetical protein